MTVLFDGDVLVYRAGFASEKRFHKVECEGKSFFFRYKKDAKVFIKDLGDKESSLSCSQFANQEHEAKTVLDMMIKHTLKKLKTKEYKMYLTHEDIEENFRRCLSPTYKVNRKDSLRPVHYGALREHLIESHAAAVVSGYEADDALGMAQSKDTIIVSIDKDLLMVPGRHYNLNSKEVILSRDPGKLVLYQNGAGDKRLKGFGFKWFCAQMLLGDPVDNIPGIKNMGPVRIYKALNGLSTEKELWSKVEQVYKERKRDDIDVTAQLLWIMRNEEEYWHDWLRKSGLEWYGIEEG